MKEKKHARCYLSTLIALAAPVEQQPWIFEELAQASTEYQALPESQRPIIVTPPQQETDQ